MLQREKNTMIKVLDIYRDSPCLWNSNHSLYRDKLERKQHWDVILRQMKEIDEDMTINAVKKRIENMRTGFKREWRKVEEARVKRRSHTPSLWYFDYMLFLVDPLSPRPPRTTNREDEYLSIDDDPLERTDIESVDDHLEPEYLEEVEYDFLDAIDQKRSVKEQTKKAKRFKTKLSRSYDCSTSSSVAPSKAESPALTVAHTYENQLKEMSKVQRCIAEKLISEVMCYGKLNLLSLQTTIMLNSSNSTYELKSSPQHQ